MSEEYTKGQIKAKEDEINRIEEDTSNKITSAEKEIEEEFDSNIEEEQSKLDGEEQLRDNAIQNAEEWTQKKKEKIASAKVLSKGLALLKSEKEKTLIAKVKEINTNKKNQIKEVQGEIKALKKELAESEKEKAKAAQQ